MTVRQQWLAAVLGAVIGIATILLTAAPGLGGTILGAAAASGITANLLDRRTKQLRTASEELNESRQQYEKAYGTLASQRERMRVAQIETDGRLAERTAALNAAHQKELFETRREWFEAGATAALTGRLKPDTHAMSASVIPLGAHRQQRGGVPGGYNR